MDVHHLNEVQLARRWNISERTLQRWRWKKKGPANLKIGGRVAYRLSDIEAWEEENIRPPEPRD
jgi:predicted DNA-binding transcriptional regulator AlpA